MKKRKILLGLALAAAAVFSLSACGDDTEPTTPTQDTPTQDTPTPDKPDTPVTPAKKNFTVNFYSNGGTAVASQTVEEGKKATKPTDPTRTGSVNTYTFAGWYTDVALTQAFSSDTAPTGDVTLYAKWTSTVTEATAITMNGTEYSTIKAAIAAVPTDSTDTYTIIIPKGTYNENGLEYNGKATIKLIGATDTKYGADVIIRGHGSDMTAEKTRNLVGIQGTGDIILENLTLVSDWGRDGHGSNTQAEVLGTDTKGNTIAYNCGFKSNQDTLRTAGKAWFYGCYIEGDVDFIWMEQAGSVALYEKCEIVSVYDATASSHASYVTAPRMAISTKAGKGLVIYNSTVKESEEAKTNGQTTYLGRSPWTSGYFSQVAYINTTCSDIEASGWYGNPISSEYDRKVIGWKMDQATATSLNYTGNDILDATTVENEFSGRRTILNRIFNCGKLKYEKDSNTWDIDAVILANGWAVDMDSSSDTLADETAGEPVTYKFDGSQDVASMVEGFAAHSSGSYAGGNGATITVPVSGKCFVEVYGFYAGTVETKANNQGEAVMFFNNGSTSAEVLNTYTVYDSTSTSVTITAKATTYITKVVVTPDTSIENVAVTDLTISQSTKLESVGVPMKLTANITPANATNKSVKWSSSDTAIAEVDTYTGKVTFKTTGQVTITATACDGSGKTASITCNPINPTWTKAEWYTTDATLDAEEGAQEIGNFDPTTSEKCSLNVKSTITNIAGTAIETQSGIKFNSKGKINLSTTKSDAILTVVVARRISKGAFLSTIAPSVYDSSNPSTKATLLSTVGADKNTDVEGSLITYTYALPTAATWTIERGDGNFECSPVVYAKCEYETDVITRDTTFVLGTDNTALAEACTSNVIQNASATVGKFTIDATSGKLRLNSTNNAQLNTGTKVTFKVAAGSKVKVTAYDAGNAKGYTINGVGTNAKEFERYYATETLVTIQINSNIYLEKIEVTANATAPQAATLASLDVTGYTTDEVAVGTDYEYPTLTVKAVYDDNSVYTLAADDYELSNNIDKTTAGTYTVTVTYNDGTTTKTATYDVKYVGAVSNVISEDITFNDSFAGVSKVEGTTATFGKFSVDASTGKLAPNGGNFQFNNTTKISFTVAAGATVKVTGYPGMSNYSLTGDNSTNDTQVKTVTYSSETEVEVTATGNGYIISIEITFPAA